MRLCKVFVHDKEAGLLQETDERTYMFVYRKVLTLIRHRHAERCSTVRLCRIF